MKIARVLGWAAMATGLWSASPASAQPLGTFRWQLQPFCNIVTLAVVQQGGQYQLDGTDDQCGVANFSIAGGQTLSCSLTTGTAIDPSARVEAFNRATLSILVPFSTTRTFSIAAPGTFTARFNCVSLLQGNVGVYDVQTSALYVAR